MFKNVILFPNKLGQRKSGVERTPNIIKLLLNNKSKIVETKVSEDLWVNLDNLYKNNVCLKGSRVNIGGDHSMSIATVADSLRRHDNLKLIWMDAHADMNTYKESITKNVHGMPLSILTGIEERKSLYFTNKNIDPKDILYVGLREMDPFEKEMVEKYKINILSSEEVNQDSKESWRRMSEFIGENPVHFSFDVDVLDPSVMPSTGTLVKNGIELESCKKIIEGLSMKNVVSIDIAELNLSLGDKEERRRSLDNLNYLFKDYIF